MENKEKRIKSGLRNKYVSPEINRIELETENAILSGSNSYGISSPGNFEGDDFFNNHDSSTILYQED